MKKFRLTVACTVECYGTIELEAETAQIAEKIALDAAILKQPDWATASDFRVVDGVEELDE